MAAVGGTVYIFGGRDQEHKELNELYSFDTSTGTWALLSSGANGPPHRSYHSMVADAVGCRVYVFGGCGDASRLNDLWGYDVAAGRWEQLPSPGEACRPRGGPGLAVAGGKLWVVYGFGGEELDDVHCYDPATGQWSAVETTGDKPSPRSVFCATGIAGGGGGGGGTLSCSAARWTPATWATSAPASFRPRRSPWTRRPARGHAWTTSPGPSTTRGPRGWCAFAAGEKDGRRGLLVYGGNSPTNDWLDDIYFFAPTAC
ncbi:hypothetical protein PVAP13_2NG293600 [Panicum virgatum]|uniref:Nitrile-specifier protein 5 n=1 Tax=Panicum virgatum TaxID=38727 RepID=A0A8T0VMQ1_PANVG|nr:hypothetical protein PVAP13_2NG293600 [Panicum virgatum]